MTFGSWPLSLWSESREEFDFPEIDLSARFDVVIVGAGYTGLWTALTLKAMQPDLSVVVVDAATPGFGASGRNGGWCSGLFPVPIESLASIHGRAQAIAMQRAAIAAVDDVGKFVAQNRIDCDWVKSGTLTVATNEVQEHRIRADIEEQRRFGLGEDDVRWLTAHETSTRVNVAGARGALFSPHCAVIHPMKLVNGLVRCAINSGVHFVTHCRVGLIDDRGVTGTLNGVPIRISADWVVRATEGYTPRLGGEARSVIPLYSYMVATEPLPDTTWTEIGWSQRETLAEGRQMVTYAQRSSDGRIVFGGRGAGYRFASRISPRFDTNTRVRHRIELTLRTLFPACAATAITHHWGGPLAVPRDWHPSVTVDSSARRVSAGGYVGDGVALSHIAGRAVAAAILGRDTPDLHLPMTQHVNRRWEPEPLRWIGVNVGLRLPVIADAVEARTKRPAHRLSAVTDRLLG